MSSAMDVRKLFSTKAASVAKLISKETLYMKQLLCVCESGISLVLHTHHRTLVDFKRPLGLLLVNYERACRLRGYL